jgi:DNA-binding SARP family transcriptional activator
LVLRHDRPVERSWLAGSLWPQHPEEAALANLRNTLVDLRRALGPQGERLRAPSRHTLALDLAGADVDVVAFDQAVKQRDPRSLEQAVALYRGTLLEGWVDDWVFQERRIREQAYLEALQALSDGWRQQGEWGQAERCLRQVIALDPEQERAHHALMEVLVAAGAPAAAVQTYRELCQLLQELGTAPTPHTTQLFEAIRSGRPLPLAQ